MEIFSKYSQSCDIKSEYIGENNYALILGLEGLYTKLLNISPNDIKPFAAYYSMIVKHLLELKESKGMLELNNVYITGEFYIIDGLGQEECNDPNPFNH